MPFSPFNEELLMTLRLLRIGACVAAVTLYATTATAQQADNINAAKFGAKGDAVMTINYSAGTQTVAGTDSTAAI